MAAFWRGSIRRRFGPYARGMGVRPARRSSGDDDVHRSKHRLSADLTVLAEYRQLANFKHGQLRYIAVSAARTLLDEPQLN